MHNRKAKSKSGKVISDGELNLLRFYDLNEAAQEAVFHSSSANPKLRRQMNKIRKEQDRKRIIKKKR